jgi:hypothetical protein
LLRAQNGGYIRYTLPDPDSVHTQIYGIYGIGPHFPSLTGFDSDDCRDYVSFELDGLIPFDGDGHWRLRLDYRGDRSIPAVTYVDVECDNEHEIATSDHSSSMPRKGSRTRRPSQHPALASA